MPRLGSRFGFRASDPFSVEHFKHYMKLLFGVDNQQTLQSSIYLKNTGQLIGFVVLSITRQRIHDNSVTKYKKFSRCY